MTPAERFAAWVNELRLPAIPSEVVAAAKLHLLDALGCGVAAHALGIATAGREAMRESGGRADASVIQAMGESGRRRFPAAAY
jgi:2-methylcitrate dehydratase PrpD